MILVLIGIPWSFCLSLCNGYKGYSVALHMMAWSVFFSLIEMLQHLNSIYITLILSKDGVLKWISKNSKINRNLARL